MWGHLLIFCHPLAHYWILSSFSKLVLVIVSGSQLSVVVYCLGESSSIQIIIYNGGVWQSLYVSDDGTIFWVIYDQSNNQFIVVCTYVTSGVTINIGIQYVTKICVVVDRLYIYVLVKEYYRIDVYSRRTLMKLWELNTTTGVNELIIGFGKQTMLASILKSFLCSNNDISILFILWWIYSDSHARSPEN